MTKLSPLHQTLIGLVLAALMIVTRGHHVPTLANMLPSASWAVFFVAGVYLRPLWIPVAFIALVGFLDYAAVEWNGVNAFCVSPAYVALVPAYGALWAAGRWYSARYRFTSTTLLVLAASTLTGTFACELISSGSFYVFSGRFADLSFATFASRFATYFPHSLASTMFWIGFTALAHVLVVSTQRFGAKPTLTS